MIWPALALISKAGCLLLLISVLSMAGCETSEPLTSSNGKKLKLQAVTHDGQTSYVYREVQD